MLFLFTDELIQSIFIHVGHELIENFRIIDSHVLQKLWELIYRYCNNIARFSWYLNELNWLWPIHVALIASIYITKCATEVLHLHGT